MQKIARSAETGTRRLLRRLVRAAAAVLAAAALSSALPTRAAAGNSDQITLHITPSVLLGVSIDTTNVTLAYTMSMGATAYTLSPATVTILGNITPQDLDVTGANVSVSPTWTLAGTETQTTDALRLHMLFSVGRSSQPAESDFVAAKNLITTTPTRAGGQLGSFPNGSYCDQFMAGAATCDHLPVGAQRQMWLQLIAPPTTSTTSPQQFSITLTATRLNM